MILNDITNTGQVSVINANFDKVETFLNDNAIDRDDVGALNDDVDMNGFRIYNLPKPLTDNEPARLKDLKDAGALGGTASAGVSTFNTRDGDVTLTKADVETAVGGTIATTFSPSFVGIPTAPTAAPGTGTTQLATTSFVQAAVSASTSGVASFNTRTGAVTLTQSDVTTALGYTAANVVSPTFTGVPLAPTASNGTNTQQIATTAFVQSAVSGSVSGVSSFNSRTGAVSLTSGDVSTALGYTPSETVSPTFTGIPVAPTATGGTNTTQLATTAFVQAAVSGSVAGVSSFNTRTGAVSLNSADVVTALQTGANAATVAITTTAASSTSNSFLINRNASYTGGTPGHVNSAIYLDTTVGAGVTSFEWGLTSRVNNYALTGENVGVYGQGNKFAKGGTWGGCFEVCDTSTTSGTPSDGGSVVGAEVDVWCNGTDAFEKRIGIDVVAGNALRMRTDPPTPGPKGYAYDGVRIGAFGNINTEAAFMYGLNILSAEQAGIVNQATGVRGIHHTGTYQVGIDLSLSTNTDSAIRIKANDWIALDGSSTVKLRYNSSNGLIEFYNNSTRRGYINILAGADVDLAATGGGGSYVDLSSSQSIAGNKTFTSYATFTGGLESAGISIRPYTTINWSSAGVISGSAGALNGYLTIGIDGSSYKIPFYNV